MIYGIDGYTLGNLNSVVVETENGNMATGSGGYVSNTLATAETRFRSAFAVKVVPESTITVQVIRDASEVSAIRIIEYDSDFVYIQAGIIKDNSVVLTSTTEYVKFVIAYEVAGYNPEGLIITGDSVRIVKNPKIKEISEHFLYKVYDGVYNSGVLMLPPNYDPEGEPVPLIVYVQGTNGYVEWNSEIGSLASGGTYLPYIEYLRDEGFAILNCFGWTSKYYDLISGTNANTFGTRICMSAFTSGIEYVVSRYNVQKDQIHMYCKSLGGQIACLMANQSRIPLKSISMLCPSIDMLHREGLGYNVANRRILAQEWEFEGNVESVFLANNFTNRSEAGEAFLSQNKVHLSGFNPGWNYHGRTLDQKFADSIAIDYTHTDAYRDVLYPVKIWGASDDADVSYPKIQEYVAQCQNAGHDVSLRTMPTGTGGHHSVDNASNAPKQNITTALGIAHTNVPLAYIEMVEFIRSRQ